MLATVQSGEERVVPGDKQRCALRLVMTLVPLVGNLHSSDLDHTIWLPMTNGDRIIHPACTPTPK
jgi:hypothetical protein